MFESTKTIFFDVGDTLYSSEEMEAEYPQKLYELIADKHGDVDVAQAKSMLKEAALGVDGKTKHVTKVGAMSELGFTRAQVHEAFCKVNPRAHLQPDPELAVVVQVFKEYGGQIGWRGVFSLLEQIENFAGILHWNRKVRILSVFLVNTRCTHANNLTGL